ncbi:hypothetical protein CYME_CMP343C [Cyanidioschyzon merolae strain 10D]|uniref:Uncharacterized protein n=1 Tax=Cyanidioschyzon merolae (strain NIES-3377 / 10D) TaxID=280699 RepID=M1VFX3_CYAM1|nr:hypothetical protein CYME_CMP343C [Cyanidioschyzon merolae strain 10D]BAM81927.1 hypothetical protein CYME_CMP343C [Cyanidioschyzon merolae strain 10D]|eukprot:XP_005537963.1 hypothetical protein CYME_CMP343C [Cyanidioschyzon merolae strain 10D]
MWCFVTGRCAPLWGVNTNSTSVTARSRWRTAVCGGQQQRCTRRTKLASRRPCRASASDPNFWRDVARSVSEQGELATSRAPVRRERPPPQWVAPPPGFELDTSGESSSTWASWRAAAEAAQAEQEAVQERLERGEPVRDMTAERNFWRSAAAELGAPLDPGRTAAELRTAAGGLAERPSEHNRSEEIGSIDSNIPESDEEWDPDTSWMQMYASDAVEFVSGTESADDNLQGTLWGAALGSEQAARERSSTSLQSLSAEWDTKERIPDSGAEAADEEETLEPRDPKKETAFWRGAAQELLGASTGATSDAFATRSTTSHSADGSATQDSEEETWEPRDPKKETAFWRGAAQELLGASTGATSDAFATRSTTSHSADGSATQDSEEETWEPRDPKKETAFWRGAAQELLGASTGATSDAFATRSTTSHSADGSATQDSEEETWEPRDPKKETAFWRGAAQDIIESLPTQIELGVDAQSSASTPAVPDAHAGTGDPDVTAEEPVGPAEAWAAWRAARASSKNVSALPAPVAETHPEPLSETEIWIQWREQQRKTWAGALNDLNRNRPREQQVARPEKSTVDRWRHVAAELSQDSPQSEENS